MLEIYKKVLEAKGYSSKEFSSNIYRCRFSKYGEFFRPVEDRTSIKLISESNSRTVEKINKEDLRLYAETIRLIKEFAEREYGYISESAFISFNWIPLASAFCGEREDRELRVFCNLIERTIVTYLDDIEVESTEYPNLETMVAFGLKNLSFDSLVFYDEEWDKIIARQKKGVVAYG